MPNYRARFQSVIASLGLAATLNGTASGKPVICIDPGHPSEVADGLGRQHGTTETHCDWVVAGLLKKRLELDGYRVVLTKRAELQRVTNARRAEIANRSHAALMVRLHCDTGGGSGYRVYYPALTGRDHGLVGPSEQVRRESGSAAQAIHDGLAKALKEDLHDNGVATDRQTAVGKRFGALIGSIHSRVPTVLVEMVFLTNAKDAEFIKSTAGQQKLAEGLEQGVRLFVPPGSDGPAVDAKDGRPHP